MQYLITMSWFTRDHGLFGAGMVVGGLIVAMFLRWEKIGWSSLFTAIGAGGLALTAHFMHWWR